MECILSVAVKEWERYKIRKNRNAKYSRQYIFARALGCCIPEHITPQREINEWGEPVMLQGESWVWLQRMVFMMGHSCVNCKNSCLGKSGVGQATSANQKKKTGVIWQHAGVKLRNLFDDVRYQIDHITYPPDEIAARFQHRFGTLVSNLTKSGVYFFSLALIPRVRSNFGNQCMTGSSGPGTL